MTNRIVLRALGAIALTITCVRPSCAQSDTGRYAMQDVMIPMRDGVKLHTLIFTPKNASKPLPIMFRRTPYGVDGSRPGPSALETGDSYIFVMQDLRGRYKSEGTFVMTRMTRTDAERKNPKAIDEATDAYDTIDWLVKNVKNNNGRVGMFGVSYDGWTTAMALTVTRTPHSTRRARKRHPPTCGKVTTSITTAHSD